MFVQSTHIALLERLGEDDESGRTAWIEFCDRYGELIRSFARRGGLQPSDCDDVLQDVLCALRQAMPGFRYDPAKGKFRSYLKTVTVHAIARRSRQNQPHVSLPTVERAMSGEGSEEAIDSLWEIEWRRYHLRQALRAIECEFSEQDLTAFRLYSLKECGARQTAEALGLTVDQVYQAKSRILRRLAKVIADQTADEG